MGSVDPKEIAAEFASDVHLVFGEDLKSVVLYGSAARSDFVPGRSDLNFLLLVDDAGLDRLLALGGYTKKWSKRHVSPPVIMKPGMLERALDSYPLEFLGMKAAYEVVFGEDPLAGLEFDPRDVRLQCERELRGKLLLLRAGVIEAGERHKELARLMVRSFPSIVATLQGLLFVGGKEHALWGADLARAAHDLVGVDEEVLGDVAKLRFARKLPPREEVIGLMGRYLSEIERLVEWVDSQ